MSKLTIAMLALCLVAAPPALAQDADPLALAAAGVLLPFVNTNGDLSVVEASAPVGSAALGMEFYDATCVHFTGTGLSLTRNDLALFPTGGTAPNKKGLIAGTISGSNPIHTRVYWFNVAAGRSRILEPVTVRQFNGTATWNPLRTGAAFFAPLESAFLHTTLYLICPKTAIQGAPGSAFPAPPFPAITPPFLDDYPIGSMRGRIYDVDEHLLADVVFECDCLLEKRLVDLHSVYSDPTQAPAGTYTEIESTPIDGVGFAFTGYKALTATGLPFDLFGRLSNHSRADTGSSGPTPGGR
jgi:hypothetical protein